jgi:vancomycin resistance protein YoaR
MLLSAAVAMIVFSMIVGMGFQLIYSGRIFPGIAIDGIPVGGMKTDDVPAYLAQEIDYPTRGKITFTDNARSWSAAPADLGFFYDTNATAKEAYQYGRSGLPSTAILQRIKAWFIGVNLSPIFVYDQHASQEYLSALAQQVDQPIVDARLTVNGMDITAQPGQSGRMVDIDKTIRLLTVRLTTMQSGEIPLVISETAPAILDVSAEAETARQLLSSAVMLSLPQSQAGDPGPWSIDPENLLSILTFARTNSDRSPYYQVKLNEDGLKTILSVLAPMVDQRAQNARFTFNDDTHQLDLIASAKIGRTLNVDQTIQNINDAVSQGQHNVELALITTDPAVKDDATAESLGITELVHAETSYYYGSSGERIQNIIKAANSFHGLLIAPGETFSMGDALGDVSLDNGYTEGIIIVGDKSVKGVGGGVCQVSTTLFRAAFFTGFPILERHAHAYRVGYYEQRADASSDPNLAGMDATVYEPVIDLKFTNDTPYWLLMETYPSDTELTWKFYSTGDGRTVESENSGPHNVVPAPVPVYKLNSDLAEGVVNQVDWAAEGADFSVTRKVIRNGEIILKDEFDTHYTAWQAVYEYGPGTKLPKGAKTE